MSTICDNILLKTIKIMSKKHEMQHLSKPAKKGLFCGIIQRCSANVGRFKADLIYT